MFIKIVIIVAILAGIVILPLITSLLFNQEAEFKVHSCAIDDGDTQNDGSCSSCQIKVLANCDYK